MQYVKTDLNYDDFSLLSLAFIFLCLSLCADKHTHCRLTGKPAAVCTHTDAQFRQLRESFFIA